MGGGPRGEVVEGEGSPISVRSGWAEVECHSVAGDRVGEGGDRFGVARVGVGKKPEAFPAGAGGLDEKNTAPLSRQGAPLYEVGERFFRGLNG